MKRVFNIILVLLAIFMFVACDNQSNSNLKDNNLEQNNQNDPNKKDDQIEKTEDSLFEEKSIQSIGTATLTSSGTFSIEGEYKVGDGVLIKAEGTSRAVSAMSGDTVGGGKSRGVDKEYYKTNNGYYLVMVSEEGTLEFEPEKMNLSEGETISIGKFGNTNDFAVTAEEHNANNTRNILEEYYYVDFSSSEFAGLDRKNIIIRQPCQTGANKFTIITDKEGYKSDTYGVLDLSEESGVGIIQLVNSKYFYPGYTAPCRICIVNPVELKFGDSNKNLSDIFNVIRINASSLDKSKEYCVRISNVDSKIVSTLAYNSYFQETLLKNTQGYNCGVAVPYFFPDKGVIEYYIGRPSEDVLLDINFESFHTGLESVDYEISIVEAENSYVTSFSSSTDITASNETYLTAGYDSSDFITVTYNASRKSTLKLTSNLDGISSYGYYWGPYGYGGRSIGAIDDFRVNNDTLGYIVIALNENTVKEKETVVKIEAVLVKEIKPGNIYKFNQADSWYYVSSSGAKANGIDIMCHDEGKEFRKGTFECQSDEEGIKNLSIRDGSFYSGDNAFYYNNHTYGGDEGRYALYGNITNGASETYVFEVDEFNYTSSTEKSITGTLAIVKGNEETATFKNVVFIYKSST